METKDKANTKYLFPLIGCVKRTLYLAIAITNKDVMKQNKLELLPTIIIYLLKINFVQFSGFSIAVLKTDI